MNEPDITSLKKFLQVYFSHPYFSDKSRRQITIVTAAPEYKRASGEHRGWMHTCRRYGAGCGKAGSYLSPAGVLEVNKQGFDCYYYLNPNPGPKTRFKGVENEDITAILWLPVDWDDVLPIGPGRIFKELGVRPALMCRTSCFLDKNGNGVPRYQALIAIEPVEADGIVGETAQEIIRDLAAAVGGDSSVCNPARLCRLPGTINWKRGPDSKSSKIGDSVCRVVWPK